MSNFESKLFLIECMINFWQMGWSFLFQSRATSNRLNNSRSHHQNHFVIFCMLITWILLNELLNLTLQMTKNRRNVLCRRVTCILYYIDYIHSAIL